ncbi:AAA family ATPase [Deinococcus wulumuqiensis]
MKRLITMLERHGLRLTPEGDRYLLDFLKEDEAGNYAEDATCSFWRLHQRLTQQDAPQSAFRSLNTHLWDLAWDAGGNTASPLLSHILLCWTPTEIRASMSMRQPVYQPDEMPAYLEWLVRRQPHEAAAITGDVVALSISIGKAMDALAPSPLPATRLAPALKTRAPDRGRASFKALNSHCLEALELVNELDLRGIPTPRPLDWDQQQEQPAMQQLRALPGLGHVASQLSNMILHAQLQELRCQRGLTAVKSTLHMVFTGNPGTGKTTVARLVGRALAEEGILGSREVFEVARADLVAEYIGQTAPKVFSALDQAEGGVLLIDEAHGLMTDDRDPFGREALDALVKGMEDRRDRLAVILCGYPQEMDRLLDANPGLRSRISRTIQFPDYSAAQLLAIFDAMCAQHDYRLTPAARSLVAGLLGQRVASGEAARGNARMVRVMFEEAVQRQATRLARTLSARTDEDISTLTADDLGDAPAAWVMSA